MPQKDINHWLLILSKLAPYELPQVIAQIPSPQMDVPMPVRKALLV